MAGMSAAQRRTERLPPPPPSGLPPSRRLPPPPLYIDREKTCPLLLRVFTKLGSHHVRADFADRGKEPKNEFQIYTWKDATLRELTDLVKEVTPEARRKDARLSFAVVYPNSKGQFTIKPVGETYSHGNGRLLDDKKQLRELGFEIGDYLDVAIL